MTELWLLRHGQTQWNQEGRYQGSRDIGLNENGMAQASRAAEKMQSIRFSAVYSSQLSRAYKTAQAVARHRNLTVHIDERLAEISLGEWEGQLFGDIRRRYPDKVEERKRNPLHARPPGGETAVEVAKRMKSAADDIAKAYPAGPVLLVSHGLALASLICQAQGISLENIYDMVPENAEPIVIQWPPREED